MFFFICTKRVLRQSAVWLVMTSCMFRPLYCAVTVQGADPAEATMGPDEITPGQFCHSLSVLSTFDSMTGLEQRHSCCNLLKMPISKNRTEAVLL